MSKIISTNPGKNYEVIGEVIVSSKKEIQEKVEKAHKAKEGWKELGVEGRVKLLRKLVGAFEKNKEKLALLATREMGMPISQSTSDVNDSINFFKWYLDNASKYLAPEVVYESKKSKNVVHREPLGVAAVITPWNYPFSNFVWGCGQNLTVGNTIVYKHSEECPLFGKLLEQIITPILPPGVFSEVYGDGKIGDLLVHENINLIGFTGSTKTGKYLYKVAAEKFIRIVLECGGSAPGIIFEDANLENALAAIYYSRIFNAGQSCDAMKRLLVHRSRFDEVVDKLSTWMKEKKLGDPEDNSTDIGPLVAKRQVELLENQVEDAIGKGARVVVGGKRPTNLQGAYYEPTLLTNINFEMRVWKEEVFGPVLPIISFESEKEALELANDTSYGLGSYLFTQDEKRAKRVAKNLQTGMVSVNNANYVSPSSPFGGYKESGLGREHGRFGFEELTQVKVVASEK